MPYDFHIGNQKSMTAISDPGINKFRVGNYYPPHMERLGKNKPTALYVREWIIASGKEQDEVAADMKRAPPTLSKLLNGKMAMTTSYLAEIADALNVSVRDFFRHPDAPLKAEDYSQDDLDAAKLFSNLDQALKDHILGLVERLPSAKAPEPVSGSPGQGNPTQSESE